MSSLVSAANGKFAGNCLPNQIPGDGEVFIATDPPDGINDPRWDFDAEAWVAGDPPEEAPPGPSFAGAWLAWISGAPYLHIRTAALGNQAVAVSLGILSDSFQSFQLLPLPAWQESVRRSYLALLAALANAEAPLSEAHLVWIEDWNTDHHLGIDLEVPE